MKKHTSEEAYYDRIKTLANVNKTSIKESQNRTLGTLVDFKRAADGVAYGIVKEQHKYYIKKGGLNENLTVADFAYIGGMANITEFQYGKLAEAEKQRNMLFNTINEGISTKVSKTGSKKVSKKAVLTEDKAGQEIEMAASKVDDLDAATDAAEVPAEPVMDVPAEDGGAEMDAGLDAMAGGDEVAAGDAPVGDAEMGADPLAGDVPAGGEIGAGGDEVAVGDEEMPIDGEVTGDEEAVAVEDPETEVEREIEKNLGKITNQLRKTELTDGQVKSYVNTFLSAFKDKFPDVDIEDRKAMAEKITKVVPPEDIEDLGQNVEDTETSDEIVPTEEPEMAEQQCAECGGFAQYAESRGYNADSIKECGEEEMTNMISGYANGHSEGQNDGDFKAIALFITPEIIEKLKGDYGHDDFANQVEPFSTEMNECSAEDRDAQINELFGGLRNLGRAAGQGIAKGAQQVGQAVGQKAQQVGQAVGQAATNIKQTYHTGELPKEVKKLEGIAANLGQQISALNKRMQKAGKEPINVASILTTIKNQVAGGGAANLGAYTNEEGIPVDSVEVQPMMEEAAIEEDVTITVNDKAGKPLSSDNVPEVEMKEGEEKEGEDVDIDTLDVDAEEGGEDVLDLTKREEPEMGMHSGFESMGGGVMKPEGAETTTVEVTKDSVNVTMNESEVKIRKYIRKRLEEHVGIRKPSLNEAEKSKGLQKLDRVIDKQFNSYESEAKKKIDESVNEVFGWSIKEKFAKLDPNNAQEVNKLFYRAFQDILNNPKMGAIYNAAKKTPLPQRYEILKQFVETGGGTLRIGDGEGVIFASQAVKNAAIPSRFTQGGTQGKTQLGGI